MTEPQQLVETALAASRTDGCVAIATEHTEANLRWANNTLTTNGVMRSRSLTVVAIVDRAGAASAGVVTRSVTSEEEVAELVRAAESSARDASPAEDAMPLVEPYDHDDDWDAPPAATGIEVFDRFAPALGACLRRWQAADLLLYGFAEHGVTSSFLGTSTGLRRRVDQPGGRLEVNGKSADLVGSAWHGLHTPDFADVDVDAVTSMLERRLGWARARLELPAGRYETLLPPTAVADLMIDAYWSADARAADEGRSAYADAAGGTRVGERVSRLPLTLRSDPSHPGLQCAPFDLAFASGSRQSVFDNGRPVPATSWLDAGTVTNLVGTRAWAAGSETPCRPAVDNLVLDGGSDRTLEDLVASTGRGLLLSSLWYIREVDPQTMLLTGLTRDGVYLVEDGEVRGAVNNFRFNESPLDLLARATEAGRTEATLSREWSDYFLRTAMPPLRVPDFNMSTVSAAS